MTPVHKYPLLEGLNGPFQHGTIYLAHALRSFLTGERGAMAVAATFSDGLRIQAALDAARQSNMQNGVAITPEN
jgi:hypothetical protein